jgi:N-acetylneuraminic acid mutarotase
MVLLSGGLIGERMYFVGGTDDAANLVGVTQAAYSLEKCGLTRLADYPGKPFATAASAVVGNELFVFGGMNYDAEAKLSVNSAEAYAFSPEKNVWRKLKPLAVPARGLTAVTLDESHIYIAGGYRDDFTAEAVIYDVKSDSYRKALSLPYAAMVGLVKMDGHVYCLGGEDKKQSRTDKFFRIPVADLLK